MPTYIVSFSNAKLSRVFLRVIFFPFLLYLSYFEKAEGKGVVLLSVLLGAPPPPFTLILQRSRMVYVNVYKEDGGGGEAFLVNFTLLKGCGIARCNFR